MALKDSFRGSKRVVCSRNPQNKDNWLTKPWVIESVHRLAILGSWVIGTGFLIEGLLRLDTTTELGPHAVVFLVLAACTVLVIKKMRLRQRLSEFAAKKAGGADVVRNGVGLGHRRVRGQQGPRHDALNSFPQIYSVFFTHSAATYSGG